MERMELAGVDSSRLSAVLVTHEHGDHAKGALALCELLDIPLYASFGTALRMSWLEHPLFRAIESEDVFEIEGFRVRPVIVPHDSREPLQFVIEARSEKRLGVLSDLGCVTRNIVKAYQGCHGLQLEANHDPVMLRNGPYPPKLQARVAGNYGHLSNRQCAELISCLAWSGLQSVTAGHISEKNNAEQLVRQELSAALACTPDSVTLLPQDEPSAWFELR
tara:strand:+ start:1457 stop:2116 length:660 start_codon:yes stop_codon:yes gene_type:complete